MVILNNPLHNKDKENMAMIQQQFDMQNDVGDQIKRENNQQPNREMEADNNQVTQLNNMNNLKHSKAQEQVYASLQSPSREDNPISSFAKPPDFISLKPLTLDEEKAILMQVRH